MSFFSALDLEFRPLLRAVLTTLLLCGGIALGSRGGRWLDPALLGYLLASVFACFGVAYRYWTWVERPATWMYFRDLLKRLASPKAIILLPKMGLFGSGPDLPATVHRTALHQALGGPCAHCLGLPAGFLRDFPA